MTELLLLDICKGGAHSSSISRRFSQVASRIQRALNERKKQIQKFVSLIRNWYEAGTSLDDPSALDLRNSFIFPFIFQEGLPAGEGFFG